MGTATATAATEQGRLWSARAADWAAQEEMEPERFAPVADLVRAGDAVLEVGCGSGVFLGLAAAGGARVAGVDAAPALVAIARERVPEADVRLGDAEALPFPDDTFDLVAGLNVFFFASDMVAALREAGRVARPGARGSPASGDDPRRATCWPWSARSGRWAARARAEGRRSRRPACSRASPRRRG